MAVANYHDSHGSYPPAYLAGPDGRPWHSWRVLLLPYLERSDLYNAYNFDQPWDGPGNRRLADRMPPVYAFHGTHRPGLSTTNYLAVVGPETAWPPRRLTSADVTDGLTESIQVVENQGANVCWMAPRDLSLATMSFRLNSPDGISSRYLDPAVATMNGGVLRLDPGLSPEALRALLTVAGGEDLRRENGGWTLIPDGRDRAAAR